MDENRFEIDKITWNDLSLDDIYSRLNVCVTSAGDDFLLNGLKRPYINDCDEFMSQRKLFSEIESLSNISDLSSILKKIGKLRTYKFSDVLLEYKDAESESNRSHYIIDLLVILSFALIFIYPGPGIVSFFVMIAVSVSNYFKKKNIISSKLTVSNYLIKIIKTLDKNSSKLNYSDCEEISNKFSRIHDLCKELKPFVRGTFLISEGARTNSNPFSIVFDYIRMIFHVDIIKYNSMVNFIKEHLVQVEQLYNIVGEIDCGLCIRSIGENEKINSNKLCKPIFTDNTDVYEIENAVHPLVHDAVDNSIKTEKNILITGCNASGKSTFLKTIALNSIFAQGLGIAFADGYKAPFYRIYSSMALKDDVDAKESYFMAEIKSLKRIVDACDDNTNKRVLCVIDEVLRGTNTVERIAASVEILKSLSKKGVLCLAATHDIELTELLSNEYNNYHFSEEVSNDDVMFSYKLKEGAASSRNAIKLLSILGYDDDVVRKASKRADDFINDGSWHS